MTKAPKTLTITSKRVIADDPTKVFETWLDPKQPCNPWSAGKTVGLEPKVGSLYCVLMGSTAYIFGRVLKVAKGKQLQHTWMSRYTHGLETTVAVDFKRHAAGTLMTLRHTGLPNDENGCLHTDGWNQFLEKLEDHFAGKRQEAMKK
jgi:uncharacterized protein YndB with AHSA1/START domain